MREEWRPLAGYEGRYEVSNQGRVKNVRSGRVHTGVLTADGYLVVRLTRGPGHKRAHSLSRLVCAAFNGSPPSRNHVVTHLSGEKIDCRAQNLTWTTRAEHSAYISMLGRLKHRYGSANPNAKLTEGAVTEMRRRSRAGASYTQLAREFGVSVSVAHRAIIGQSWRHVA